MFPSREEKGERYLSPSFRKKAIPPGYISVEGKKGDPIMGGISEKTGREGKRYLFLINSRRKGVSSVPPSKSVKKKRVRQRREKGRAFRPNFKKGRSCRMICEEKKAEPGKGRKGKESPRRRQKGVACAAIAEKGESSGGPGRGKVIGAREKGCVPRGSRERIVKRKWGSRLHARRWGRKKKRHY